MLLHEVVLGWLAFAAVAYVLLWKATQGSPDPAAADRRVDALAAAVVAAVLVLLAVRSRAFGVDTEAYADAFNAWCFGGPLAAPEQESWLASLLIDAGMLGACDVRLLPAVWGALVCGLLFVVPAPLGERLRYAALLLLSLVGIELTTNALRQGLAAGLTVGAIAWWPRRRSLAALLGVLAVALHASAGLVLGVAALALSPWPVFLAAIVAVVAAVLMALTADFGLVVSFVPVERALEEVQKYSGHRGDEVFIRLLSFASLLAVMAAGLLGARPGERRAALARPGYGQALRLTLSCAPLLALPYFGYRYVYGVYPVVLWLVLDSAGASGEASRRTFAWALVLQVMPLLAWAAGSSYMRSVPFLG